MLVKCYNYFGEIYHIKSYVDLMQEVQEEDEEDDYGDEDCGEVECLEILSPEKLMETITFFCAKIQDDEEDGDGDDGEEGADGDENDGQNSSRTTRTAQSGRSRQSHISRSRSGGKGFEFPLGSPFFH